MPDTVVAASLTLDSKQADQSVASFKAELKKAQQEVLNLTDKFGATSKAATDAAKRAAELKDRIGDAKKLVDSFNPDEKFRGFTQVLTGVAGGFSAITGAMGLLGVQSEDVQKQLLKVQSALAITQGLNSIGDSIQSFKNLGATLVQTLGKGGLIGVAIAGVSLLAAGFLGLFDNAKKATEAEKAATDSLKDYSKATAAAIEDVTKVGNAFKLARDGVISKKQALFEYNETLGDSLGRTNDINEAERLFAEKSETYVKVVGLRAQANALFGIAAQKAAEAEVASLEAEKKRVEALERGGTRAQEVALAAGKARSEAEQAVKSITELGQKLELQAQQLAAGAGVQTKSPAEIAAEAAAAKEFINTHVFINGRWYSKTEIEQAKKDAEERSKLAGAQITGKTTGEELPKTPEQLQFEAESKARHDIRVQEEADLARNIEYKKTVSDYNIQLSEERVAQEQLEFDQKKAVATATIDLLNSVADLFGRQTAAGKVLGVATATINTLIGITEVFRAKSILPEPIGTIVKIASAAALAANGFATVKKIVAVNVPGAGGGSASAPPSLNAPAPLAPKAQVGTTQLDQQTLNNTNNATVRAFVLDTDNVSHRERNERLNRAARLGG